MNLILDSVIFDLQKSGGISKFWAKHLENLEIKKYNFLSMESSQSSNNIFRKEINLSSVNIIDKQPFDRYKKVKVNCKSDTVFHSSYFRNPDNNNIPVIHTVHDFMYEKFDSGLKKQVHILQKKLAMKRADVIVCVSNKTKEDMFELYPWTRDKLVHVIHNGTDNEFYPILDKSEPLYINNHILAQNSYFLYVGARGYCKNFDFVIDVMKSDYAVENNLKLVCVGGGGFSCQEVNKLNSSGVLHNIIKFDGINSVDLNNLYNYSKALIIPSIYEGFGIPALEAARTGTIVLGANNSSIPEVVGDETFLFSPFDLQDAINKIEKLDDSTVMQSVSEKLLSHSQNFTWENMTNQYTKVYEDLNDVI